MSKHWGTRHKVEVSLPYIYAAALCAALLFALIKGGHDAKLIAAGFFVAQIAAIVVHPGRWDHPQLAAFVVDLLLLGWLGWILLRTSLAWPIATVVLQALTVLGHCARMTVPSLPRMAYFVLIQWTAWPAFLVIVIGTVLDWRAGRTSDASWRARE